MVRGRFSGIDPPMLLLLRSLQQKKAKYVLASRKNDTQNYT